MVLTEYEINYESSDLQKIKFLIKNYNLRKIGNVKT